MTLEQLQRFREYLRYEPETGHFYYIKSNHPKQVVGAMAGGKLVAGYLSISLNKVTILAHRLAWYMVHGVLPSGVIDHINMIPTDNRICNLRDTSRRVKQENRKWAQTNSTTKLLGAFKYRHGFRSQIKANGIVHYLGVFNTAQEAHEAYIKAKRELHEGNTL